MKKKPDFETAIAELEEIVTQMETDDLSLEKAITAYERSQDLINNCQTQLSKAQALVKKISADPTSESGYQLETFEASES